MNKAFSLLEVIFVIIILGIIAGVGIPKLLNTKSNATSVSVRQDVNTIINSLQSHYLINGEIQKISDTVNLNKSIWTINDKKVTFMENDKECLSIEIDMSSNDDIIKISINPEVGNICQSISDEGITSQIYNLN